MSLNAVLWKLPSRKTFKTFGWKRDNRWLGNSLSMDLSLDSLSWEYSSNTSTVYPKKYAHGFVVLCFVVVMQSFIMNSHEVFIHIHQGCFAGTGAIVRLPQCQWSKPDGYGKISPCITTTKHSKAKTVCIFLGIYCIYTTWISVVVFKHVIMPDQRLPKRRAYMNVNKVGKSAV